MRPFSKWTMIAAVLIVGCLAGVEITHCELKETYRSMIEVAYMNGYIEAVQLDNEQLKTLKADRTLLKQRVQEAAQAYIDRVSALNAQ